MQAFHRTLLAILLLLGMAHCSALAAGIQPLQIEPSRIILEGMPGQDITSSVTVTNSGQDDAVIAAVLFDWTLGPDQQLVLQVGGESEATLADWIKFNPRRFTIPAGSGQIVRFTVRIPRDAAAMERRGMIAFQQSVIDDSGGAGATTTVQVTSTIYTSISPVIRTCTVADGTVYTDAEKGETRVELELAGNGTAHYRGSVQLVVYSDGQNEPLATGQLDSFVVLPGVVTPYSIPLGKALSAGTYTMDLTITSEESRVYPLVQSYDFVIR